MRIAHLHSGGWLNELDREFEKLGHEVTFENPDLIISNSVSQMQRTFNFLDRYPGVKLYSYNWDVYKWVWKSPRDGEYDYVKYGELLKKSDKVFVPSECTRIRTLQWFGIDSEVVLSYAPFFDMPAKDDRFVLMPLRQIPDEQWGWFEKACEELNIPYYSSGHKLSFEEYKKKVANCSFIVSPLMELSTGGLTLLEGYYLGKPILLCDSKWHGGRDYFGEHAEYFKGYDELKIKLKEMWENPQTVNGSWIKDKFTAQKMAEKLCSK